MVNILNRNIKIAILTHITTISVSIVVGLLLPKVLSITDFGYWQYFMFFASCLELFLMGSGTGLYLKYGGKYYDELDYKLIKNILLLLIYWEIFLCIIFLFVLNYINVDINKKYIFYSLIASMFIINIGTFFSYILQATNRIKENCVTVLILNILLIISFIILILLNIDKYYIYILIFIIAHIIRGGVLLYYNKKIIFIKSTKIQYKKYVYIFQSGIYLLIADYSVILLFGIGRLFIENIWGIIEFSKFSFAMSLVLLGVSFVNQIGLVLFPELKKNSYIKIIKLYYNFDLKINVVLLLLPLSYFVVFFILSRWLSQYIVSLYYLGILMPLAIFESKMSILINPYYKALRKEKFLLYINFSILILGVVLFITLKLFNSNILLFLWTFVLLSFSRNLISEILLSKVSKVNFNKSIYLQKLIIIILFIILLNQEKIIALITYLIIYLIFFFKYKSIFIK